MSRPDRSQPLAVKHWSFAGLMLTYRCNARCRCCYVNSGPESTGQMSVEQALTIWQGLHAASPHGCRIHIGGGEPFLCFETLIELARRALEAKLGPLQAVETNAFWATDEGIIRERLAALDQAGMGRLNISCDPFHQEFIPIANVRRLSAIAGEMLGAERVRVRWRDWQEHGSDLIGLEESARLAVIDEYLSRRRERLNGRAANELAGRLGLQSASAFADQPCGESLLRSRHAHVDAFGLLCPGTCAGIALGHVEQVGDVARAWQNLRENWREMPIVGTLAESGPWALALLAAKVGYVAKEKGYAGKCHLCWDVRKWLCNAGQWPEQLAPAGVYALQGTHNATYPPPSSY